MLRVFLWELRNGHWNAATKLTAVVALIVPILNFFLKRYLKLPDSIADLLVPVICILILVIVLILNLNANHKKRKNRNVSYSSEIAKLSKRLASKNKFGVITDIINTIYVGNAELTLIPERDTRDIDIKALSFMSKLSYEQFRRKYSEIVAEIRVNTAHALVPEGNISQSFDNSVTEIEFIKGDYAALRTLIENLSEDEFVPRTLGAGGLLVSLEQEIYLLNKGNLEKPLFHVFGGNFEPNLNIPGMSYDRSLSLNAEREIMEECGCTLNVDDSLFIVHRENSSPDKKGWASRQSYLPVHYMGVVIPKDQLKMMRGSPEGKIHKIKMCDLADSMSNLDHWIPAAWLTVITWLYLGAPCQNGKPVFSKSDARKQFEAILR